MRTDPRLLPPVAPRYRIINARVDPVFLPLGEARGAASRGELIDIVVDMDRIGGFALSGGYSRGDDLPVLDLDRGMLFPRFVDVHTHIDKGHIAPRTPNPDGTHMGARAAVGSDRQKYWNAEDVRTRMEFSLRCAYAHGTGVLRTHIDSLAPQADISWPVFDAVRSDWRGRIKLQAVALFPIALAVDDEVQFKSLAATVSRYGGVLGGLTFHGDPPDAKFEAALDRIFETAGALGLDVDFHVDESDSVHARTLEPIADAAMRRKFKGKVLAGHCCSLALASTVDAHRIFGKLRDANVTIVSLPMCNMYLQDRIASRTPRWRGVAPLHELYAAGVDVLVASDNTRDPFYAYGDLDMLEVCREATRILQFDHSDKPWMRLLGPAPAEALGLPRAGRLEVGGSADFVMTRARLPIDLMARPQSDRAVVVTGRAIDTTLPDYRELDHLFG